MSSAHDNAGVSSCPSVLHEFDLHRIWHSYNPPNNTSSKPDVSKVMVKLLDDPVSDCCRTAEVVAEDSFRAIPGLCRVEITEPEEIYFFSSIWSSPHSLVPVDMDLALGAQPKVLDMARAFFGSTPARNVKRRSNFPSARISGQIHAGKTQYREL